MLGCWIARHQKSLWWCRLGSWKKVISLPQVQSSRRCPALAMQWVAVVAARRCDCGRQDCPYGAPPCSMERAAIFHLPYDERRSCLPAPGPLSGNNQPCCSRTWLAGRACTTTNRTSRAMEDRRRDGRDVLALSPERPMRSEPGKQYGSTCGTLRLKETSAPHCTAGQNKKLEDAEQRGAQKLHVIELSEVGTDASNESHLQITKLQNWPDSNSLI